MEVQKSKLEEFFSLSRTQFAIPVFQRNYDWGKPHCKQLLDDIVKAGKGETDSHFVGSVVYLEGDTDQESKIKELMIIDGQQRITTLTLMYIAIREIVMSTNPLLAEEIADTYLFNKYASREKLKLRPTQNNDAALKYLLNRNMQSFPHFSNLVLNYDYFKQEISAQDYKIIMDGLSKLTVVRIALEKGKDDPQQIFESINSTGLELSQADLIRNYILMKLNQENQNMVYDNYWKIIEEDARDETSNQSRVSDYIRDYLTIKNNKIPNKGKVYLEFKNRYPCTTTNFQSLTPEFEKELGEMTKLVARYNKLVNPSREADKEIRAELKYINQLEINVAYPFLMKVYDDYESNTIDKPTFLEVLKLVQSYVWRRFVFGLQTNELNKIFMTLYEKIDASVYLPSLQRSLLLRRGNQKFPTDDEVKRALSTKDMYNIKPKSRNYYFEKIENHNNREPVSIIDNEDIQIEHIFPQNPSPEWKVGLGKEYHQMQEFYLHTIGNLTLSGSNNELSNKLFADKRDMKDKGYKDSRLWLNKGLGQTNEWNVREVEKRCESLTKRFLQVWQYPDIALDTDTAAADGESNIFDAGDPTHKGLEYVIFFDTKEEITSAGDLYEHVFRQLYELAPEKFHNTELKGLHRAQPHQPLKISDSFVMEKQVNSAQKFRWIKKALTIFDLEDELIIKYASE